METCFVARGNSGVLTVKLGRETSLVAYSTDKRSSVCVCNWPDGGISYCTHFNLGTI